jgi:cobaltochelatase CobS
MSVMTDEKIKCELDGALVHSIELHLRKNHPAVSLDDYRKQFPTAPLLSEKAKELVRQAQAKKAAGAAGSKPLTDFERKPLFEVFGLPKNAANNSRGAPIEVSVMVDLDDNQLALVPDIDPAYVFNIELVKTAIIALELNEPMYLWGYHGTGKTTILEQTCARTKRPFLRVQHTANTEESHIIGQYVVRSRPAEVEKLDAHGVKHTLIENQTVTEFQLGPLPQAMIEGLVYCADEYDFAMPNVTSVYQPVLEGKPLVIKDAPPEFRIIRPHPNFRFVATGNTNGVGDETGLYQGTNIQNAANYSRFGIVEEVEYMAPVIEAAIVSAQAGIPKGEAEKLVEFANKARDEFKAGKIGSVPSTRELIKVAKNALVRGGNYRIGLRQGFLNRLSRSDKGALDQVAQRMFG